MGGRIKRDGSYDERNRYYEKRDYSFRSTTFFVSYVTLNATTVTKSATIHYGTSNPTPAIETDNAFSSSYVGGEYPHPRIATCD